MQKIVELNLDEIVAVTGGHKAAAVAQTTVTQPTLTMNANMANFLKPALAQSTQSGLIAFRY